MVRGPASHRRRPPSPAKVSAGCAWTTPAGGPAVTFPEAQRGQCRRARPTSSVLVRSVIADVCFVSAACSASTALRRGDARIVRFPQRFTATSNEEKRSTPTRGLHVFDVDAKLFASTPVRCFIGFKALTRNTGLLVICLLPTTLRQQLLLSFVRPSVRPSVSTLNF